MADSQAPRLKIVIQGQPGGSAYPIVEDFGSKIHTELYKPSPKFPVKGVYMGLMGSLLTGDLALSAI